ncbi:MAG: translational activator of GCN4 [Vezdaea aestivalis]|nr:MAG: translational activator of GCN4 [Vezdaea aestivalis]
MAEAEVNGHDVFDLKALQIALQSSSTSRRISQLNVLNGQLREEESPKPLPVILKSLFTTYPFYSDRPSRFAVQECLQTIFTGSAPADALAPFIDVLTAECRKTSIAASNALVLVEWTSLLVRCLYLNQNLWAKWGIQLLAANGSALELCVGSDTRPAIKHSAIVSTRRGLRSVLSDEEGGAHTLKSLVIATTGSTASNSVFLGVVAGVCARKPQLKDEILDLKKDFYKFYASKIIGSRTTIQPHIADGLHDFFAAYATEADLAAEIVPSLEKALLRSPEIVLNDLVRPLIKALPISIDLSAILQGRLLKPLLANVKSTNPIIRAGVLATFEVAILRCQDSKAIEAIAVDILTPLKASKVPSADQRTLMAQMLAAIPTSGSLCVKIAEGLSLTAGKETNEVAGGALILAISKNATFALSNNIDMGKTLTTIFSNGLNEKRVPFRRLWAIQVGEILLCLEAERIHTLQAISFVEALFPKLMDSWKEVLVNPLSAAQSGLMTVAFVVLASFASDTEQFKEEKIQTLVTKSSIVQVAMDCDSKPSFLLNPRILSKLVSIDDTSWALRALVSCSQEIVTKGSSKARECWAQALIFFISSSSVPSEVRRQATSSLSKVYVRNPGPTSTIMIKALFSWQRHIELSEKDTAATLSKAGVARLHLVIRAICLAPSEAAELDSKLVNDVLQEQLVAMVIICRSDLIPRVSWIEVCLRCNFDPGTLAQSKAAELMQEIEEKLGSGPTRSESQATYNAVIDLAFVAPDIFTPYIVNCIKKYLNPSFLDKIGPTEAAIFRTPKGTTFVDVLDKKGGRQLDKNSKDYETLKWEEEVRARIAAKTGQQRKMTAEEQNKFKVQLEKEKKIRQEVSRIVESFHHGIGLINAAVNGPPTDAAMWMETAVGALLGAMNAGAGLIIGDAAANIYIACSKCVAARLGPVRSFIGIATLRAMEITYEKYDNDQEPLGALITRILYRLRFASEQRPFDTVSLSYMLPLIFAILRRGGAGHKAFEDRDEQVILALEFLSFHTPACTDSRLPRATILETLIYCMQRYSPHYKIIKDCLLDLSRAIAPNVTNTELQAVIRGTIVPEISVRASALQAIDSEFDLTDMDFCEEIWIACHDDVEENAEMANSIWEDNALGTEEDSALKVLPYLENRDRQLRCAAAKSLAAIIHSHKAIFPGLVKKLQILYKEKAKEKKQQYDEYGMLKKMDLTDLWECRSGVALAFKEMSKVFDSSILTPFIKFLIEQGPFGDRNEIVRDEMVEAATVIIATHAKHEVEQLMAIFESTLESSDRASEEEDRVHEAVIIMYGSLGRHLSAGDARVPKVVKRLLATLSTPSENVQFAVANCLPPLIRASAKQTPEYVQQMLDEIHKSKKFAARRGAAYGLAGIIHGKGISILKEYRILSTLRGGIENKKESNQRQGSLFAYELFSLILGPIFEPYVIEIVPQLLSSFGDANADVRQACLDAAKTCFANLSSFGVKQILPTLLDGLEDQQWRSKKGACDLLGAMAYLDPQQLASSLPEIIPPLTNVLNDSHKEVRTSANRSLQRFGEVISNPEIKSVVNILLKALSDPTKHTDVALESLIKVSFVHYLDAPSLALVVRILQRGLGDRSATKRKSAQIIGSLAHLTERKDLVSHLSILVAGLKIAIVDPVPTTRATASKALGSLIEKLGEDALPDLIPSLMSTLKSDTGAGDRLGSAQALSEVLAGLGTSRLEETLPTILQNVSSSKPSVREGFMSLFIYLPACFGNSFASYLNRIIPPILSGLADDIESIRETSLRAGRLLVKNFATKAIDLLLPELERGLADDSHRIRLSSVELVGDLLFNLTGISVRNEQDDDASDGAAEAGQSLLEVLGEEKRNKVLSSLYICRCDTSGLVRNAAILVWKALVASPRTLKELVPTLTQLLIRRLASSNMEQKVIAGNALGELIRKAGDGVLSTLLPTLEEGLLTSTDSDAKQGICIALRELITSASYETLEDFEATLTGVVRTALLDPDEDVRDAAAEAFDSLQRIFGKRAIDQVLPNLLQLLRTEDGADNALSALLTLLTDNNRSNMILPNLIPTLIVSPITSFNAKAIASLASVAGQSMTRRLSNILNALMDDVIVCEDEILKADLKDSFLAVLLAVDEYDGLNASVAVMLALVKNEDHRKRFHANTFLASFFTSTDIDYSRYYPDLIRILLISFDDRDPEVVKASWSALSALTSKLRKEEMEGLVHSTRQVLLQVGVSGHNLPGFAIPNGIKAILPIFLQGLMNGTAEQRTQSALAISDIAARASPESLKPFIIQMTGPLIRVVSERSTDIKIAVLFTLNNLLEKVPASLKPFLPQLQRTFAKSLADTSSEELRSRAAKALGTLITLTPKVDPLISELVTGSRFPDPGVQNAMNKALYEVVSKSGSNMSETSREAVLDLTDRETNDEAMIVTNARLLGALIKALPVEKATTIIKARAVTTSFTLSTILSLNAILVESSRSLKIAPFPEVAPSIIAQGMTHRQEQISENSVLAAGKYLLSSETNKPFDSTKSIFKALATVVAPGSRTDARRLALVVLRTVCRQSPDIVKPHTILLAPPVFSGVRDPVIPIKLSAEAAFLELFDVVEQGGGPFEKYITGPAGLDMPSMAKRSMQDYFKRVALRLAGQARERREAEGGQGSLGLSADEKDDEREVWSVGRVDLGEKTFKE